MSMNITLMVDMSAQCRRRKRKRNKILFTIHSGIDTARETVKGAASTADVSKKDDVASVCVCTCQVDASDKRSGISSVSATPETKLERRRGTKKKGVGKGQKSAVKKHTHHLYPVAVDNARCVEKCVHNQARAWATTMDIRRNVCLGRTMVDKGTI